MRKLLEEKTTKELHEILTQTCSEDGDELPDMNLIHTILEILNKRAPNDLRTNLEEARANILEIIQLVLEDERN